MAVVLVTDENRHFFKDMMSDDMVSSGQAENVLTLGSVNEGLTDGVISGELLPSGVFLLDWLYVAKTARRKGIAGELLEALVDALRRTEASSIIFSAYANSQTETVVDFLSSNGFQIETCLQGGAELEASEMMDALLGVKAGSGYVMLSKAPAYQLREFIGNAGDSFAAAEYEQKGEAAFARESCVNLAEGKITAAVLASDDGDDGISILALEGKNVEEKEQILKYFLSQVMLFRGRKTRVCIACGGRLSERILRYVGAQEEGTDYIIGKKWLR